jgi:hypothetical protein
MTQDWTKEDLHVVAGVHFRLREIHDQIADRKLTVELAEDFEFNAKGRRLGITDRFLTFPAMMQIEWVLTEVVAECPYIASNADGKQYVDLAKRIAEALGRRR